MLLTLVRYIGFIVCCLLPAKGSLDIGRFLLLESASGIGFAWNSMIAGGCRPGLSSLSNVASPIRHCGSATVDARRDKVSGDFCKRN